jgi:hypothetical protein
VRWSYGNQFFDRGPGENPPRGVVIHYALQKKAEGEIKLEVLDSQGAVIRSYGSKKEAPVGSPDDPDAPWEPRKKTVLAGEPGVQRVVWDLGYESATAIKKAKAEGDPEAAPVANPGAYTARLTVAGQVLTTPIEVRPDPRQRASAAELDEQLRFNLGLRDAVTRLSKLVARIRSVRGQLEVRNQALGDDPKAAEWVKASEALMGQCDTLEAKLHNPKAQVEYDILAKGARLYSRLSPLLASAVDGDGGPTQGMREVFATHATELAGYEAEWAALQAGALAELNRKAREAGLSDVMAP